LLFNRKILPISHLSNQNERNSPKNQGRRPVLICAARPVRSPNRRQTCPSLRSLRGAPCAPFSPSSAVKKKNSALQRRKEEIIPRVASGTCVSASSCSAVKGLNRQGWQAGRGEISTPTLVQHYFNTAKLGRRSGL
jgi:hypothetical protein